jgi:hypothetical protein
METALGKRSWVIPEGYIPGKSTGPGPDFISHETACILNAGEKEANIDLTIFYSDRDPVGPYKIKVPAKRTLHLRFNDLQAPEAIPKDTDYSSVFLSDVPVVIQHTRLDSRQAENALLTTMAYSQ